MDEEIKYGTDNIFADMGLPNAEERLAKAELARQIHQIIRRKKFTQVKAGRILGIDQPKVSNLLKGRLAGFSLDRLIRFLNALDKDIEIRIKPKSRSHRHGRTRVVK